MKMPLAAWRATKRPKLTQHGLTKLAGLANQTRCWQIESGNGPAPSSNEKTAIASALGVRVRDIEWSHDSEAVSA